MKSPCSGFCYPGFFLPVPSCVPVQQWPWLFVHVHMKKGKRCADDMFSPIPFLCPLLLWEKRAPNFQVPWPDIPHKSLCSPTLRLFCTSPMRKTSLIAWLLNDCSVFFCSTTYYLLLQDTIHFCPTPSDLSTSQKLTQILLPRTFLSPSHVTGPFTASLFCNHPPCHRLPHHPRDRQRYDTSPLSTVSSAPHPPFFILLMHRVKLGTPIPGRMLAFHGLDLAHRLTPEEPCVAVLCPLCSLLSKTKSHQYLTISLRVRFAQASKHTHQPSLSKTYMQCSQCNYSAYLYNCICIITL